MGSWRPARVLLVCIPIHSDLTHGERIAYFLRRPLHKPQSPAILLSSESEVAHSCLTLYNPMDNTVSGILQVRILEWVAVPFSKRSSRPRDQTRLSCNTGGFSTDRTHPSCPLTGFPGSSAGKESAYNAGNLGSIPGLAKAPGGGHGNPPQYSCLENSHGQRSLACCSPWGHRVGHD